MPVERCGRSLFTTTLSVIQDSIMDGLHRTRVPKKKKYVIVPVECWKGMRWNSYCLHN